MNRERAKELLPAFTAFVEGETIQCRARDSNDAWVCLDDDDNRPAWIESCEYRVKPEPREFWLYFNPPNKKGLDKICTEFPTHGFDRNYIHVREVLND